jgi:segregation and condensation protein B
MQKRVLEAALFMSSKPLMLDELARLLGVSSLGYVKQLIQDLQKDYSDRGIEISNTPQGWRMQVRPEFVSKVSHLTPYSDMSEGVKRTLALVVYKEPALQSELIHIQGNKAYSYVKELRRRGLISIEKRGHTKIISLTKEFERYFGEERQRIREMMEKSIRSGESLREEDNEPEAAEKPEKEPEKETGDKPKETAAEGTEKEGPAEGNSAFRRIDIELD